MSGFEVYLIEVSVISLIVYLFYCGLLGNHKQFNYNRFFLLGGMLLSLVLPVLSFPLNSGSYLTNFTINMDQVLIGGKEAIPSQRPMFDIPAILIWIYFIGVGILSGRLLIQLFLILKLCNNGELQQANGYKLLHIRGKSSIGSFMHIIFWNVDLMISEGEKQTIIAHEKVHVLDRHTLDVLFAELYKILLWFNPIAYLLKSSLRKTHEYIADSIASHNNSEAYLNLVAKQVLFENNLSLTNRFYKSQITNRMKMLKKEQKQLSGISKIMLTAAMVIVAFVFSCEPDALKEEPQPSNSGEGPVRVTLQERSLPSNEVYTIVENQPRSPNGMTAYYQYVKDNIQYPAEAKQLGIEGKVFVQFVVTKDGTLSDLKVLKGIGGCLNPS